MPLTLNGKMPELAQKTLSKDLVALQSKIETRQARIGILGLGYVGLPLALEFAKAGFYVTGFDVDPSRIRLLLSKRSYIGDIPEEEILTLIDKKRFYPTTNFSRLEQMDAIIICVPTPLNKTKDPDISFIASATDQISRFLRPQQLIVLESTTYPGTTRECMLPRLEAKGLKVGKDVYLAFSPERIDPGNAKFKLTNTPKVVGGITENCCSLATLLYRQVVSQVIPLSSPEAAEMVKILENTFRAVNIGLVNEMAMVCDKLHLDVWEIIEAAATKPYGFMPFFPGPGLGGHCIPVDPHYLSWKMKSMNFLTRFIELASEVNSHMPEYVVERISRAMNDHKKSLNGSNILILGVTYKPDVGDVRESPALDILHLLQERGVRLSYHDPYVPEVKIADTILHSKALSPVLLKSMDAVVIVTPHRSLNTHEVLQHSQLVMDTRNATHGLNAENLVRL
jgi:UDP-N-acetyl-D-glucosamine dehydrogenase